MLWLKMFTLEVCFGLVKVWDTMFCLTCAADTRMSILVVVQKSTVQLGALLFPGVSFGHILVANSIGMGCLSALCVTDGTVACC